MCFSCLKGRKHLQNLRKTLYFWGEHLLTIQQNNRKKHFRFILTHQTKMLNALDFKRWLPTIHGSNVLARFTSRVHKIVDVFAFQQIFSQTFLKLDVRTVCKCVFH